LNTFDPIILRYFEISSIGFGLGASLALTQEKERRKIRNNVKGNRKKGESLLVLRAVLSMGESTR
jgi:hypothetical protein